MKDRKYFVLAVIVAVSIPLAFGSVYFYYMSRERGSNNTIAKLENERELVIFGDKRIEGFSNQVLSDNDYKNGRMLEFEVDYASGKEAVAAYTLYASNVDIPRRVNGKNFSWKLVILEPERDEYRTVAMGNFLNYDGKVILGRFQIPITDSQKFRLYYYLNDEVSDANLYAVIGVE